ncbi:MULTISPECIES: hypothetical protein [Pseudomonas]|uniref:Uncharacterized protein n=1 Tax=Pseudomonas aphyarum TaxID=2942629 RepID=A0ABT5PGV8_9PSED|nr:hypothetical protein [Pseudomonas aphyarum]MDD0967807.1 hypothetical protein [Pseudomonas aphyarum]MDD1123118.1 hypothetical protein [Pseudomonas aphyarum]
MAAYDLYGVKNLSVSAARSKVEESLELSLDRRESGYHGGEYYFFGNKESEHLTLKNNIDPFDGEAVEQEFPEYPVLLYVDSTGRAEEITKKLAEEFFLLRRELLD